MCDVFSITKLRLILFSKSYKFDLGFPNMKECTSGFFSFALFLGS